MYKPFLPENEAERLKALDSYAILDTLPESDFDDLTQLASQICETPISLISLIDEKRQWFKSHHGLEATETAKDYAFCAHAILEPANVMVVQDSLTDDRFKDNPLAIGHPNVVFYAGVPLVNPEGYPLGTLCVIDHQPKQLSDKQLQALKVLAKQVISQLELRRKITELKHTTHELQKSNQYLERFALMASHDIKTPLTSIMLSAQIFKLKYTELVDDKANVLLDTINHSSKKLLGFLNTMLDYSKSNTVLAKRKEQICVNDLLQHIIKLLKVPANIYIELPKQAVHVKTSMIALEQIFINLLHNSVKYSDKRHGLIRIEFFDEKHFYHFKISDNGKGIEQSEIGNIFSQRLLPNKSKHEESKAKLGLSTVKNLVESLGGEIKVKSILHEGACFEFTIRK